MGRGVVRGGRGTHLQAGGVAVGLVAYIQCSSIFTGALCRTRFSLAEILVVDGPLLGWNVFRNAAHPLICSAAAKVRGGEESGGVNSVGLRGGRCSKRCRFHVYNPPTPPRTHTHTYAGRYTPTKPGSTSKTRSARLF